MQNNSFKMPASNVSLKKNVHKSAQSQENDETLLDYKYTATLYRKRSTKVHRVKRTLKPYMITNTLQHFIEKDQQKCTELREQWNLTWLQIHRNTLP